MDKEWFEMQDVRRRKLDRAVWIPLRAQMYVSRLGVQGRAGYEEEFFGAGTVAVAKSQVPSAENLDWGHVGIGRRHYPECRDQVYIPAESYLDNHGRVAGCFLVLVQHYNAVDSPQWHLHPDVAVALGLRREGDVWVRPDEGYIEVIHLQRGVDGEPCLLEMRAEQLKDYLCARDMELHVSLYRSRVEVVEDASFITWKQNPLKEFGEQDTWWGSVTEIHEGGQPYGQSVAIIHATRKNVDFAADLPAIEVPHGDDVEVSQREVRFAGQRLFMIRGELWRDEWVDAAAVSTRIRKDKAPATAFFITDEKGTKEGEDSLVAGGRWLWFSPGVIAELAKKRGGSISWYTRDTGEVRGAPDCGVHFGINRMGLVNVYAKDIALLPGWLQTIWAGFNVAPEGGVSKELLAAQAEGKPADTLAPEPYLPRALNDLGSIAHERLGVEILRAHAYIPTLLQAAHRFRALDRAGLYSLAKDLSRLTADALNAAAMQTLVKPPAGQRWGSLKTLEALIGREVGLEEARRIMSPLFGINEVRQLDAHLPGGDEAAIEAIIGIDSTAPFVHQGWQMLDACVSSLYEVIEILRRKR